MKILKCMYNGTEQVLPCTEDMIQWAKENAVNGEYIIEDDSIEVIETPSELDKLDARLTYVEMMTGIMEV